MFSQKLVVQTTIDDPILHYRVAQYVALALVNKNLQYSVSLNLDEKSFKSYFL